jgi:hypothetical protein
VEYTPQQACQLMNIKQNVEKEVKMGDWVLYNNNRKKCFGTHHNGNILIKMNGTLVQVSKEKIKTYV